MLDTKQKKGPCTCPECEFQPFTRNHYFTGKLLVERDFCQEQDYYRNKLRLHEHRLHGSGVVCGLLVKQHPNPACRSRFVCIEPGLAIDCCGHEILVAEEDCTVDLTQLESMKPLFAKPGDPTQYTLQICVRYKECPTEQIPVLYDECGCDETQCAPNRILESYAIDVIVNPDLSRPSPLTPSLSRKHTVNVAHAAFAAVGTAQRRLYVLDNSLAATLSQFSTDNQAFLAARAIGGQALALAVSSDGNRVYVVVAPPPAGSDYQLLVVDASKPGLLPAVQNNPIAIPGSANSPFSIAFGPDGHLYGLNASSGDLIRWGTDIDSAQNAATPAPLIKIAPAPVAFALSGNGKKLYAVGGDDKIQVVDLPAAAQSSLAALPANSAPSAIAVVNTASGELLAVADHTNKRLYLVDPSAPAQTKGPVRLNRPPIAVLVAPDGRWAYVVESDQQQGYATTVDLAGILQGVAVAPGPELPLGLGAENPVLDPTGQTLYVPYVGANVPDDGGVAIVDIEETDCCGLLWKSAEACSDCDKADCIVLATIFHYVAGFAFTDPAIPPSDPNSDLNNKIARIDNRTGRRILPSTSSIADAINCLCEAGAGGKGPKGDPGQNGAPGQDGLGIDDVIPTFVPCDVGGSARIAMVDNKRTLELQIPGCCNTDLTHICGINWPHAGTLKRDDLIQKGLLIAFDRPIEPKDIHRQSVKLFAPVSALGGIVWTEVKLEVLKPVRLKTTKNAQGTCDIAGIAPGGNPNGIMLQPAKLPDFATAFPWRVVIYGDLIGSKDSKGVPRGVDIDHLPEWLPNRLTGDGIEGGEFLSYFLLEAQATPVNRG